MKKLLIALLMGVALLPFMAKSVSAKLVELERNQAATIYSAQTSQPTQEAYGNEVFDGWMVNLLYSSVGGKPTKVVGSDEVTYTGGMVGGMTEVMAWMFNSPAATTERYVADVLNSAGVAIAQPAYAQGLGFASLDPILNTWKTFRNMAYLLFVVVFMVIGFLIMMRQKVGGQTVVTAQQAIPHIIVALLLVTFSYAIAGLLIDLMYLVMYLLLALFDKDNETFLNKNFLELGWVMISNGTEAAFEAVQKFSGKMESSLPDFAQDITSILGGLTLSVVVAIAITLKIFELFFELLKTYITIVLTIAFSPVILAMGALPGKDTFKQWILDLVGNLAAFPTVMLVLIVFDELTGGISGNPPAIEQGGFQPPYLFGSGSAGVLPFMVGVGMLMIMPEIVKEAKTAVGAKEGIFQKFATKIGESAKKGWEGGEIIPGVGVTDTRKFYGGGISGKNLARKGLIGGSTLVGGVTGAAAGVPLRAFRGKKGTIQSTAVGWGERLGQFAADKTKDEQLYTEGREQRQKKKESTTSTS